MPGWMMLQGGRWPQRQAMAGFPESRAGQSGPAAAASLLKAAHPLGSRAPCRSPVTALGWEPGKPCMEIKPCSQATPVVVCLPHPNLWQQCQLGTENKRVWSTHIALWLSAWMDKSKLLLWWQDHHSPLMIETMTSFQMPRTSLKNRGCSLSSPLF